MEVPTKWSRASVISFIKGLGKQLCITWRLGSARLGQKHLGVPQTWTPVTSKN